jgi:hypothetical protein
LSMFNCQTFRPARRLRLSNWQAGKRH